jgi:hypothetical protein
MSMTYDPLTLLGTVPSEVRMEVYAILAVWVLIVVLTSISYASAAHDPENPTKQQRFNNLTATSLILTMVLFFLLLRVLFA